MLQNYLKIALRNLLNHKVFSIINIFGLSIGIACCVLLSLFIKDELSFETQFQGSEKIYRITSSFIKDDGTNETFPRSSPPVTMTLLAEFPELEAATRVVTPPGVEQHLVRYENKTFYEKHGALVDSTFFDVFSYDFLEGDRRTAMDGRSVVVISAMLAKKLFGNQSALDHSLIINSGNSTDTFRVTGILRKPEKKSHLDADFYMSMNSNGWGDYVNSVSTWAGQNFTAGYIKLKPNSNAAGVEEKLPAILNKYGAKDLKELGIKKQMHLQALRDIHLYSNFSKIFGDDQESSIATVYILASIGIFILLIACINFMNLTTAKASQRAGEVGVRKSLGANRRNLIGQFLGESMTIVTIAMILAIGIVQGTMPIFNSLTNKELSMNAGNMGYISLSLISITLITGLIAGSYPAFFLSALQPIQVLKNKKLSSGAGNWLRKSLVVFQFVISITLISSIIIIQKQMNFVKNQPLGFNPDYKIMIPLRTEEAKKNYQPFKDKIKQISGINEVSGTTALPSTTIFQDVPLYPAGSNMEKAHLHFNIDVDENYFKVLGIKLLMGRDLIAGKDTSSFGNTAPLRVLVNQASLKVSGIDPAKALGEKLYIDWQGKHIAFEIIGVVEDFHQNSFHQVISPLLFIMPSRQQDFSYVVVSVDANHYQNTVPQIEKAWKQITPNTPFENQFLTDNIRKQYERDDRESLIITISTLLAILISCLGLYGLSIYVAERKMKEIGIRKVLGASVQGIVAMLSRDFIKLVLIAFFVAAPLGYLAMNWWLQKFVFKIELNIFVFLLAGLVSFAIAWITVGFESIRAALGNPVDSLRND